jgi:hypothetical protein
LKLANNPPWRADGDAVQRVCIQCQQEFGRRMATGRLRSPRRWRRALFCSRACCAQHRLRRKASPLIGHLAGLDPSSPLEGREARPKMRAAQGRPSRKTGTRAIERAKRASSVLRMKAAGATFREIGMFGGGSLKAAAIGRGTNG